MYVISFCGDVDKRGKQASNNKTKSFLLKLQSYEFNVLFKGNTTPLFSDETTIELVLFFCLPSSKVSPSLTGSSLCSV